VDKRDELRQKMSDELEEWMHRWRDKAHEEGLNFRDFLGDVTSVLTLTVSRVTATAIQGELFPITEQRAQLEGATQEELLATDSRIQRIYNRLHLVVQDEIDKAA